MIGEQTWLVLREGDPPACLKGAPLCRGCSGWRSMLAALRPGGAWAGAVIHCSCTGLTVQGAPDPTRRP